MLDQTTDFASQLVAGVGTILLAFGAGLAVGVIALFTRVRG